MILQIATDLYHIGECMAGRQGHEAIRVYVMLNQGRPILIDCGSHLHRAEVMADLEPLLAGTAPHTIFLTHSELPHAGNLQKIAGRWPDIQVMVSNIMLPYIEIAPILPLAQIIPVSPGTALDFPGRRLEFVEALLKDQPGSQWIYDSHSRTLFSGDGFGYYHRPDQCNRLSDELEHGITIEQFQAYHEQAFRFLRWVIAEKLNAALAEMFQGRAIDIIAPSHGNAIRHDIAGHVVRLQQALSRICQAQREKARDK
jgi:flavorubredoxin